MTKKILMVLTSHDQMGDSGEKTGFWLEEFAAPYYVFHDAGHEITLASPEGGKPPVDPRSTGDDSETEATKRFRDDAAANEALETTHKLSDVNAKEYDAIFYPGGHGPLWDLVDDRDSIRLIETFWTDGKPVGAVCHAPIVFKHTMADGKPLVAGRKVTGFTNGEEDAVGLTDTVPHLVEDTLKALGGEYSKADDFAAYVQVDGHLVTGQNPPSSTATAEALLDRLAA
ncbi:type 1 glutamine amidotransferase domain-containing protein [Pontivivens insulae]|uniref:General stress protein 18 n=1 Tax=Pontivivens insulae TaxID=1639689 RepID=A0A2R8AEW2_9RHOB|nr:type 1 glutamine amidotransferase domain-containing protein [Pontivivens insulae]RED12023.1 putative intracellular protease/amidase [Pontivivens insulae]SPF30779.1 General stress protein 18 [Pontivivens insulae]